MTVASELRYFDLSWQKVKGKKKFNNNASLGTDTTIDTAHVKSYLTNAGTLCKVKL